VTDEDGQPDWHDHPGVVWAAGVAALALVGLLVFAVIRVSGGSSLLPGDAPTATSLATSSTSESTSTSTSYPVPSVQTSEDTGPPVTVASTEDDPGSDDSDTTTTPTTTSNPYGTTTPTNAGHI
jgi:hypothetical protein